LCTRIYVKSQQTSNGDEVDGGVVIVGGEEDINSVYLKQQQ